MHDESGLIVPNRTLGNFYMMAPVRFWNDGNTRARRPCHYDRLTLQAVLFTLAAQTGWQMFCQHQKEPA